MRRQRTGKSLVLSQRDLAIFHLLERYRYLRSTVIHEFVGGRSATRFKERLGDLYHEGGYLDRPPRQWESIHSRYRPIVYENTGLAREILATNGLLPPRVPGMPYGTSRGDRQFVHSLLICEVLASIELQTIGRADLRFVAWPEIFAKAPDATRRSSHPLRFPFGQSSGPESAFVIPDGLFGIEYRKGREKSYRFFALELDCGTMPVRRSTTCQSSFGAKLRAYREFVEQDGHKARLGIPNLLVLTVTSSETRKQSMMTALPEEGGHGAVFLFRTIANLVPSSGKREGTGIVCNGLWERCGHPVLDIFSAKEGEAEKGG